MINKAVAINPRMFTSIVLIIMRWKGKKINFAAAKLIKSCLRIVFFIYQSD
jgi:hypothetical protein